MKEKTDKLLTLGLLGLAILICVFAFIFALNTTSNGAMFDVSFWIITCMVAISFGVIIIYFIRHFWKLFLVLIGLGILSFLVSPANDIDLVKYGITEGTSKFIGAVCILSYIICIAAGIGIFVMRYLVPKKNKKK